MKKRLALTISALALSVAMALPAYAGTFLDKHYDSVKREHLI